MSRSPVSTPARPASSTRTGAPGTGAAGAPRRPRGLLLGSSFASAWEALLANRLRSLLTILGVIVGVAAVIAVVTLTQGASAILNARVASLGTNVLTLIPGATTGGAAGARGSAGSRQSLTQADADAIGAVSHIVAVSPVLGASEQIVAGAQNWNTRIQGVYPGYQTIANWQMSEGAWFSASDEASATPVVVLGQTVVANLFSASGTDPLGQTVLINGSSYMVVGTLKSQGTVGFANQDDVAFIPFSTANARINTSQFVSQIQAQVDNPNNVNAAQQAVTTLLEQRHNIASGAADDFSVRSPTQFVQTAQQSEQTLAYLLIGIAAISLLVGGIGIMNIMLVSVTERTREIGVRMAVGARRGDIRNQFLVEALTLSGAGGLLGVALGLAIGAAMTQAFGLPFTLSVVAIALAVTISVVIGIVFGFYPALRASRLDPIVALRSE
jgi:putative ABC transport system permease protein